MSSSTLVSAVDGIHCQVPQDWALLQLFTICVTMSKFVCFFNLVFLFKLCFLICKNGDYYSIYSIWVVVKIK